MSEPDVEDELQAWRSKYPGTVDVKEGIETFIGKKKFDNAKTIIEGGNVQSMQLAGGKLSAAVKGTELYDVQITLAEGGWESAFCSCKDGERTQGKCKHVGSVLLACFFPNNTHIEAEATQTETQRDLPATTAEAGHAPDPVIRQDSDVIIVGVQKCSEHHEAGPDPQSNGARGSKGKEKVKRVDEPGAVPSKSPVKRQPAGNPVRKLPAWMLPKAAAEPKQKAARETNKEPAKRGRKATGGDSEVKAPQKRARKASAKPGKDGVVSDALKDIDNMEEEDLMKFIDQQMGEEASAGTHPGLCVKKPDQAPAPAAPATSPRAAAPPHPEDDGSLSAAKLPAAAEDPERSREPSRGKATVSAYDFISQKRGARRPATARTFESGEGDRDLENLPPTSSELPSSHSPQQSSIVDDWLAKKRGNGVQKQPAGVGAGRQPARSLGAGEALGEGAAGRGKRLEAEKEPGRCGSVGGSAVDSAAALMKRQFAEMLGGSSDEDEEEGTAAQPWGTKRGATHGKGECEDEVAGGRRGASAEAQGGENATGHLTRRTARAEEQGSGAQMRTPAAHKRERGPEDCGASEGRPTARQAGGVKAVIAGKPVVSAKERMAMLMGKM